MAASDLDALTHQKNKEEVEEEVEKEVGVNIARTIQIISKLLFDYCILSKSTDNFAATPSRTPKHYLTAIYFDKIAEFFCRFWTELKNQQKIRYSPAFERHQGFHGPGRTLVINRSEEEKAALGTDPDDTRKHKRAYTTEIVEKLKPSLGEARILFSISGKAWEDDCKISPQLNLSQWESWLHDEQTHRDGGDTIFLTPGEIYYVNEISRYICLLEIEELRAIGTHQSSQNTCDDIRFNLRPWEYHFKKVTQFLENESRGVGNSGNKMVILAREVVRKSDSNRAHYEKAYRKILGKMQSQDVKEVFNAIQKPPEEIWDDYFVARVRENAKTILNFSIYCRRGLVELGAMPKLKKREIKESEESFEGLKLQSSKLNINLFAYNQITPLTQRMWVKDLSIIKSEIFRLLPPLEEPRNLGIDDE